MFMKHLIVLKSHATGCPREKKFNPFKFKVTCKLWHIINFTALNVSNYIMIFEDTRSCTHEKLIITCDKFAICTQTLCFDTTFIRSIDVGL